MTAHFPQCIFAAQSLPKAKASWLEFVLKDWFNNQLQRSLNYAIFDSRYTERPPSLAFGYVHTSYRLRRITSVPQCSRQFSQIEVLRLREALHAHSVYPSRPGVAFDLCPPQSQCFKTRYFVDQTVPFASFNPYL